jgi:hypothetical protein
MMRRLSAATGADNRSYTYINPCGGKSKAKPRHRQHLFGGMAVARPAASVRLPPAADAGRQRKENG